MTCKDCIYYNKCFILETFAEKDEVDYYTEYGCNDFKNKADFVEVVRCRECKHCRIVQNEWGNDWYFCGVTVDKEEVKADDYCSYGEKREDND